MDKETIKNNFSCAAETYDQYANVQNLAAERLLGLVASANDVLEIGCGTGNYTKLLVEKLPQAKISAFDISEDMIKVAKTKLNGAVNLFVADGENARFEQKFDLITSNACLQWFDSLESTLNKYKTVLKSNGMISFSLFGPKTYQELGQILAQPVAASSFLGVENLKTLLGRIFEHVDVRQELVVEEYSSLRELLRKIKATGVQGANGTNLKIKQLEQKYALKFGKIIASYEIIYAKAS